MITDRRKSTNKCPSTGCLVSIFTLESVQNHSYGLYAPYKKPTQFCFGTSDVRYWVNRVTKYAAVPPG